MFVTLFWYKNKIIINIYLINFFFFIFYNTNYLMVFFEIKIFNFYIFERFFSSSLISEIIFLILFTFLSYLHSLFS